MLNFLLLGQRHVGTGNEVIGLLIVAVVLGAAICLVVVPSVVLTVFFVLRRFGLPGLLVVCSSLVVLLAALVVLIITAEGAQTTILTWKSLIICVCVLTVAAPLTFIVALILAVRPQRQPEKDVGK